MEPYILNVRGANRIPAGTAKPPGTRHSTRPRGPTGRVEPVRTEGLPPRWSPDLITVTGTATPQAVPSHLGRRSERPRWLPLVRKFFQVCESTGALVCGSLCFCR
ncbi:hypothetical protein Psi02_59770 [Planotetraspora silvatica]|uniref:Uncharacterized protein n=1 Tax=Planotetraspora silvatica TaxID=234614 RepID=A0A8J3UQP1_9ACTN|nr:hypothetical protein Psi02_59770 [Planotetraspora silvatica]